MRSLRTGAVLCLDYEIQQFADDETRRAAQAGDIFTIAEGKGDLVISGIEHQLPDALSNKI